MQVRAYNAWAAAKQLGRERAYAAATYLSGGTMAMIEGMRGQLLGELTVRLSRLSSASCPVGAEHLLTAAAAEGTAQG